jgi:hypothetical protein
LSDILESAVEYMLLIYHNEEGTLRRTEAEKQRIFGEFAAFTQEVMKSGHRKAGAPLEFTPTAATVRVRDGKTMVTDGPFAETKEQLGGYVLVEAKDLDEAISIAARIPSSKYGSTEVRPVVKINM